MPSNQEKVSQLLADSHFAFINSQNNESLHLANEAIRLAPKNQNVIHEIKDIYSHKFKTLSDADQAVDLLNNVIGRKIGKTTSIDSTSKDIAKKVLDYYYTNGLNIVKETDD